MTHADLTHLVRQGLAALDLGNTPTALVHFQQAAGAWPTAVVLSCLGYCLARERRDFDLGLTLVREALRREPANPLHYLNKGRIYLLARKKHLAFAAFRKGLEFGRHQAILGEMKKMGRRRRPVFRSLGRKHPINRCCGLLLNLLGIR